MLALLFLGILFLLFRNPVFAADLVFSQMTVSVTVIESCRFDLQQDARLAVRCARDALDLSVEGADEIQNAPPAIRWTESTLERDGKCGAEWSNREIR